MRTEPQADNFDQPGMTRRRSLASSLALVMSGHAGLNGMATAAAAAASQQAPSQLAPNPASYDHPGWAARNRGGQGGRIIRVTNLQPAGEGSLRAALEAVGPRIVVFEIGGVIDMAGAALAIKQPNITVAGQTAPAPGITIIKAELTISTHDVIIQHLMFRPGEFGRAKRSGKDQDGISTVGGAREVIIDHCSFSWATDENLSASGHRFLGDGPEEWRRNTSHRITYSHNLIYEGLSHSVHEKGEHSKGSLIHDNTSEVLLYRNIYASNLQRNALFKGGAWGAMVNNLIFNPGDRAIHYNLIASEWRGHDFETGRLTLIGNLLRHGPSTDADTPLFVLQGQGDVELHMAGNLAFDTTGKPVAMSDNRSKGQARIRPARTPYLPPGLQVLPAAQLEQTLPAAVGARPWNRDPLDAQLLADMARGVGRIIDSELENPMGYPQYASTQRTFVEADWNLADMSPRSGWQALF